jgi:hypothetical protein
MARRARLYRYQNTRPVDNRALNPAWTRAGRVHRRRDRAPSTGSAVRGRERINRRFQERQSALAETVKQV